MPAPPILNNVYYLLKPLIPRKTQISLRRRIVRRKKMQCLDTWPIDEKAAKEPAGWSGWPGGKEFALVLTHDVDTQRGQERCLDLMELEKSMGFASSFNFVPERYPVLPETRGYLEENNFEVGVHGLYHDGRLYKSREIFRARARRINYYLKNWKAVGFRSPSMQHNLEWIHELDIQYDASTFDTDPFEPQPDGVGTIFPIWIQGVDGSRGYVELPYTLPQDFTLFVLMGERDIDIWKRKTDWIAYHGGMVLLNTHPDYMNFKGGKCDIEEYTVEYYKRFLDYIIKHYSGHFWHALPRDMAEWFSQKL